MPLTVSIRQHRWLLTVWRLLIAYWPPQRGPAAALQAGVWARRAALYAVGAMPRYRLNTQLKRGIEPKPDAYTISETRNDGFTSNVLAFSRRTRVTYSVSVMPVARLNSLQK